MDIGLKASGIAAREIGERMDSGSEHRGDSSDQAGALRALTPPSSGLAKSIRGLFDVPGTPHRGASSQATDTPPEIDPEGSDAAPAIPGLKSGVRDRFVTRLATYLRASPESGDRYVSGILEDASLLRKEGGFFLILDAVAALLSPGSPAGAKGGGGELAREMMDPLLAHYLALRISTEGSAAAREPLITIARAFPSLAAPALAEILVESSDSDARRVMRGILVELGEEGKGAALALLRDPRWFAVRNGVRILADSGDREVIQALTVLLAHSEPRVRKETVIALSRIGGEDAGLLLVGMLSDTDPGVREVAALGAGKLGVVRATRPLLEMVASEQEEEVLAQVLLALGELGDPGAVPAIEKKAVASIFNRPARVVRIAAYRALAKIGSPHARSLVEAGGTDKDEAVRKAVMEILGRTSSESEDAAHSVEEP